MKYSGRWMKTAQSAAITMIFNSGLFDHLHVTNRQRLTVLNYHRIEPKEQQRGAGMFQPNISATPEQFVEQISYLKNFYNPISLDHLLTWLQGNESLPDFPALVTFDDGYRDNFIHAAPILQRQNCPAVIFLTTGYINKKQGFYWDVSAYCFTWTNRRVVDLPLLGKRTRSRVTGWNSVLKEWVEKLKLSNESEKQQAMLNLPSLLEVEVPDDAFARAMMTWDEVRELQSKGISFGAHTVSHPILARIPLEQAAREMTESKQRIEHELNLPTRAFAYPNGQRTDITPEIETLAKQVEFEAAFSLVAGPSPIEEVRQNPFFIRRIFISHQDDLPRFAVKLTGGLRLLHTVQSY
jgi:peptidoglycan/xylan/chitin deacetylase (PgdA/CDA1 family)